MIALPEVNVTDLRSLSDWVEICALVDSGEGISQATIATIVKSAGLVGGTSDDLPPNDESFRDGSVLSDSETGERFVERLWELLSARIAVLGDGYPYGFEVDCFARSVSSWEDRPAFTLLLLADLAKSYPKSKISIEANSKFPEHFERVVTAAQRGFFGSTSVRFGWPPADGGTIEERIELLGDTLDLAVENLVDKVEPSDKDRGLDVVTRMTFGDDGPGTATILTQCATGKHWRRKTGEPAIAEWHNIFRWESKLIRGVAVPWRFDGRRDYVRNHLHFDGAIILDRMRLLAGKPDAQLEGADREAVTAWCKRQIAKLPVYDR